MKTVIFNRQEKVVIKDKKSASYKLNDLLREKSFEMDFTAHRLFKAVSRQPGMKKAMSYRSISLWNLAEEEMYYRSFFHITFKEIVRIIELVKHVIDKERPGKIIIRTDNDFLRYTAAKISKSKKIPFKIKTPAAAFAKNLKNSFARISAEVYISLMKKKRHLISGRKASKSRILFVPYYANHVDVLAPVIRLMKKKGIKHDVVVLDNLFNVTKKAMARYGLDEYGEFERFIDSGVSKTVRKARKEFRKRFMDIEKKKIRLEYKGIDIWPFYKKRLRHFFYVRMPEIVGLLEASLIMLDKKKPSIIVIANSTSLNGKILAYAARMKGIKSLVLQHGSVAKIPPYTYLLCGKMAVEGKDIRTFLAKMGIPSKKLIVTGQPRYDTLFRGEVKLSKKELYAKLRFDENDRYFVVTTQPERWKSVIKPFLSAMNNFKGYKIVIKPHPGEYKSTLYKDAVEEAGMNNVKIIKDIDLYSLLKYSDLMFTISSTTAIEAVIMNIPVLTVNFTGAKSPLIYSQEGLLLEARSEKEIVDITKKILSEKKTKELLSKNRKKLIDKYCGWDDGRSSERVMNLILKISKK